MQLFKMPNKSQNLLFPYLQLVDGPSSINIVAFLPDVHNVSFLALIVNLIRMSALVLSGF
jgi:hypothetical protein